MKKFTGVLKSITPENVINEHKNNSLQSFFLTLGLIYNDIKGIVLFEKILRETYEAPKKELTSHSGEMSGVQMQIWRLAMGICVEFFNFIAKHQETINSDDFKVTSRHLSSKWRRQWKEINEIALQENQNNRSFLSQLRHVRSNIIYHYDHNDKELKKGFREFFFIRPKDEFSEAAYYSMGHQMEGTRFYFCDAAVRGYIEKNLVVDGHNYINQALEQVRTMNTVVAELMHCYLRNL